MVDRENSLRTMHQHRWGSNLANRLTGGRYDIGEILPPPPAGISAEIRGGEGRSGRLFRTMSRFEKGFRYIL